MNKELRQKGWSDMSQQLDTHLPSRRRRLVGLWWLWAIGFLAIAAAIWWSLREQSSQNTAPIASTTALDESEFQLKTSPIESSSESVSEAVPDREALVYSRVSSSGLTSQTSKGNGESFTTAIEPVSKNETEATAEHLIKSGEFEASQDEDSRDVSSSPEVRLSKTDLEPVRVTMPATNIRLFSSALPLLQAIEFPFSEGVETNTLHSSRLFADLSSGLRMVAPHSYLGQIGVGWRNQVSEKLSYDFILGAGIEGFHREATTDLKERETLSSLQDNEFGQGPNNSVNADRSYGQASFQLRQSYFTYLGAAANYSFAPRWSVSFGLDLVYRVYNSYHGYYQIEGVGTDVTGGEFQFTSRMINDQFQVFNRWDLRTNLSVGYDVQSNMRFYLSYRHGFSPILAHPSENTPAGRARFLALGCQYAF